jgi:hypothetical protein
VVKEVAGFGNGEVNSGAVLVGTILSNPPKDTEEAEAGEFVASADRHG